MRNVLDAGFDVVDTHPQTPTGWAGPDVYDFTATDAKLDAYLSQSTTAKLIVRFWLGYSESKEHGEAFWWAAQHPGECVQPWVPAPGETPPWAELMAPASWGQLIAGNLGASAAVEKKPVHPARPSYASVRFREAAGEALRRVVAHVEARYGDRVAGYVTGGGPCGEWFHWHADEAAMMDYGSPMRVAYQAHLRGLYRDVAALNQAWGTQHADFGQITLPTPLQRFHPTHGNLRSVASEQAVYDFYDAYHGAVRDTLLHWAAKTKEGCRREKVVMVFYGYLWNHIYGDAQARSGHAHLNAVLESPDVDAIVAPFCYSLRQMDGVITGQGMAGSARRHGKLYVHELDGGTNLVPCWNSPHHHVPRTPAETGHLFRRELNKLLCEGSAGWYMDLRGGYYDSPKVVAELRRTLAGGASARPEAGRPNTEIAVVLDPRTSFHFREGEPLLSPLVDAFKQHELARLGLGFDDLTLDDLLSLSPTQTARYRLWIFPCAVHLSAAQQEAIRQHACRNGNHVVWNYAVNVCGREALDLDGMEQMTGFRCGAVTEPGDLAVTVRPGRHPWTRALAEPIVYGTYGDLSPNHIKEHAILGLYATDQQGFRISPRFHIVAGGETLGTINDLPGNPCGLALRPMDGWVSVLSCAPMLTRCLLRRIAETAGCHVYTDFPGQVVQCQDHVGLFFHADGPCEVDLPRRAARVVELYSGAVVGEDCSQVTLQARRNHAVLLRLLTA